MEMTTPMLPALDDSGSPLDYSNQTEASQDKDSMWSDEIQYIELEKGDRGLGFSILDYQVRLYCSLFTGTVKLVYNNRPRET